MNLKTLLLAGSAAVLLSACGKPVAQFSYDGELRAASGVRFANASHEAESYEWDFGDGNTSQEANPEHRYHASGEYTVRLKAVNAKGKTRTHEEKLHIGSPKHCLVEMITPYGNMLIQLYDATPQHQDNFTKLVEQGYFDSLLFHRVINGFMIQGGDPKSKGAPAGEPLGSGGPGYTIPAEFVDTLIHVKGALAAARTGDQVNPQKRSSGSQFYIVQGRPQTAEELDRFEARKGFRYSTEQRKAYMDKGGTPQLDREYTVFGQVIEGLDVIDKIAAVPTDGRDRPRTDVPMKIILIK
ncbi:MAG TPA: peptidylprolyl isomerase [Flavilitoribacter sp.]|nr:peptidylprolyl isomerase [Flavilitoribacter sp.]